MNTLENYDFLLFENNAWFYMMANSTASIGRWLLTLTASNPLSVPSLISMNIILEVNPPPKINNPPYFKSQLQKIKV